MIQISQGQSLLDVVLQTQGSLEALFELADANGLAISDVLTPGQVLSIPAATQARPEVAAYFAQRGQRINTKCYQLQGPPVPPEPAAARFYDFQYFNRQFFA